MKLHIGCGTDPKPGWVNLDMEPGPGIDVVANIETERLPFDDDTFDEMLALHVLEHIHDRLTAMQELWRVAKPDAVFTIATPYRTSDDAVTDQTHVATFVADSWQAFAQPWFWRAPYRHYTADWQPEEVELQLPRHRYENAPQERIVWEVQSLNNVVAQMVVTMRAVKPARPNDKALWQQARGKISLVDTA